MELSKILFEKGKDLGFDDMEVYYTKNRSFNIKIFEREILNYSISEQEGLSFRGLFNEKMGYAYTEKVDKSSVDMLVKQAKENAMTIESDDEEFIFGGSKEYKEVNSYNTSLEKVSTQEKIDLALALELEVEKFDKRVDKVDPCMYSESFSESMIVNSKGLELKDKSNLAVLYAGVKVKDGEDIKTASDHIASNDYSKFDIKKIAKGAVEEATAMLGAKPIASGDYNTVLREDVSSDILASFTSIFSAEAVQKDLSRLKGKLGEKISNDIITIVDDPFLENGLGSTAFDSEGVATKYKKLVDKGVLKTFLHSLKTAKKDNVEPTGNGFKGYKSTVSIGPTNMYILPSETSLEDMISPMESGFMVTEVQGLHSGLNTISGDFSLSASGFLIKDGKVDRPVNQVTIAGNFFDMLNDIEVLANDLDFGMSSIAAPSMKIKKLSVAGQ